MSQLRRGYLFGVAAYLSWGLIPIYLKLLRPSTALEILAHRVVWSCLAVLAIALIARNWRRIGSLLRTKRTVGLILLAAVLISANWFVYIYSVNADRVIETSLGYFINPLVTVLLSVWVMGERLRLAQWCAVGMGGGAIVVLTVDYGHVPAIALFLAITFALYGLIKKTMGAPAVDGLLLESTALALPSIVFIGVLTARSQATFGSISAGHTMLMMLSGLVTAGPLLLFVGAANRIPLSAIGLLQYLAPCLQFGFGVVVFNEPMPPTRLAGFILVWLALAVLTWDGIRRVRGRTRRPTPAEVPASATV